MPGSCPASLPRPAAGRLDSAEEIVVGPVVRESRLSYGSAVNIMAATATGGSATVSLGLDPVVVESNQEATPCAAGDCNGDGQVTIDELIAAVDIALGQTDLSGCPSADANQDGSVTVDELIVAVNAALEGCPGL